MYVLGGNQNSYSRRSGHQQDIPSLLSQSVPTIENDNLPPRQRNNGTMCSNSLHISHSLISFFFFTVSVADFNSSRDDFNDRRQPYANRGFNNQSRGARGGPAFRGNFGTGRGNMRGGKSTSFLLYYCSLPILKSEC